MGLKKYGYKLSKLFPADQLVIASDQRDAKRPCYHPWIGPTLFWGNNMDDLQSEKRNFECIPSRTCRYRYLESVVQAKAASIIAL